ncbi:MAG: hypothetical protein HY318_06280 [Armatimonadetes bacterium]|nr:hypothetical protein [Armatimonadota bacterium]
MYLSDWDDQYPGAAPLNPEDMNPGWTRWGQWVYVPDKPPNNLPIDVTLGALYPYVKNEQVYLCPSAYYNRSKRLSYSMNLNLTFAWEGKIGDSSSTILLIDESKDLNDGWFSPGCPYGAPGTDMATVIHNSGSNYLFCDGHVKWVKPGSPLVDTCLQPGPFYP